MLRIATYQLNKRQFFCVIAFSGFFHWGLLAIIWLIALIGIVEKFSYVRAPRWLNAAVYVGMGWLCLFTAGHMCSSLPVATMIWLIVGGVIYTFGAVIYAMKAFNFVPGKFGFHEGWHIFLQLGGLAHFISVMTLLVPPA